MKIETIMLTAEEDLLLTALASALCSLANAVNDYEELDKDKRSGIRDVVCVKLCQEFNEFKQLPKGSRYNREEWLLRLLQTGLDAYDMAKNGLLECVRGDNDSDS